MRYPSDFELSQDGDLAGSEEEVVAPRTRSDGTLPSPRPNAVRVVSPPRNRVPGWVAAVAVVAVLGVVGTVGLVVLSAALWWASS